MTWYPSTSEEAYLLGKNGILADPSNSHVIEVVADILGDNPENYSRATCENIIRQYEKGHAEWLEEA